MKKKKSGYCKKKNRQYGELKICIKRVDLRVFKYVSGYNLCFA